MSIESHYNLTLTVNRPTFTQDAQGGKIEGSTLIGSSSGRARNLSGSETEKIGRDSDRIWLRVYTSATFTIDPLDKVTISGSDGGYDGVYEVRRTNAPQTSLVRHHWELDCVRYT
jgi:hypothetical protein